MSEEDVEDRRFSFDCLMTIISRNAELVTSIPMLEFLGIDLLADRKYKKRRQEYLNKSKSLTEAKADDGDNDETDLFTVTAKSKASDDDDDLFEVSNSSKKG